MSDPWHSRESSGFLHMTISMYMKMLALFIVLFMLAIPYVNEKAKQSKDESTSPPGNVIVEVRWPDDLNADVDLWVKAPGDVPVGYSNKGGAIFNLLRDDLGVNADPTKLNYEVAYARGLPPGEYIVNLHLYRNLANVYPVKAVVSVSAKSAEDKGSRPIVNTEVELTHEGQEYTALRFTLDPQGNLVPKSLNNIQKPLRSGAK